MTERAVFLAYDITEWKRQLLTYVKGDRTIENCWLGRVGGGRTLFDLTSTDGNLDSAVERWIQEKKWDKVAQGWAIGCNVDWSSMYRKRPKPVSLPTYPFAKERYWKPYSQDCKKVSDCVANELSCFSEKEEGATVEKLLLTSIWEPVSLECVNSFSLSDAPTLVFCDTAETYDKYKPDNSISEWIRIDEDCDVSRIREHIKQYESISGLVWIASKPMFCARRETSISTGFVDETIRFFRTIKALLGLDYGSIPLNVTVVTFGALAVLPEEARDSDPVQAGLHGLVGSLAKEYPIWNIRLVDLILRGDSPIDDIYQLPSDENGNAWAFRSGQWFRQKLLPVNPSPERENPYRNGGVYILIGGAGGIGRAFSEELIRSHQAKLFWIGRRPLNDDIQREIDRLGSFGPAPIYLQANAADRTSLASAYKEIKKRFSQIHGVVHAAIVLHDRSLAEMTEEQFRKAYSAKADVCVCIERVFGLASLDFILFFSATMSFAKAPGQGNYAAGCTYKDAFAAKLGASQSYAVKTIQWGYWGDIGIVANDTYRRRMTDAGHASITTNEAVEAVDALLNSGLNQLAFLKITNPKAFMGMPPIGDEEIFLYPDIAKFTPVLSSTFIIDSEEKKKLSGRKECLREMEDICERITYETLTQNGWLNTENAEFPAPYDCWLRVSLDSFFGRSRPNERYRLESLWGEWEIKKESGWIIHTPGMGESVRSLSSQYSRHHNW